MHPYNETGMHLHDRRKECQIKAVLFDLDGVLINSYDAWFHLFNDTLEHFGYPRISEPVFRKHWGQSTKEDITIFMPGKTIDEVRRYFIDHYQRFLPYITCDPDGLPVLHSLRSHGLLLGCVTNSHLEITQTVLRRYALHDCFDVILTADDVACPKPAPDILIAACQHLQIEPKDALFVGDTHIDLEAGSHAGCILVGYRIAHPRSVQDLMQLRDMISAVFLS
jgi:HAD superfamily hydrolase (TIGR01509 family)